MPVACAAMQLNPDVDWMYTADPGEKAGLGLNGRRMPVPRGKMLGGSSSINYMMYVRGHPGDFDSWAEGGATGWSYDDVLPYFRKSEGLAPSSDIVDRRRRAQYRRPAGRFGPLPCAAGCRRLRRGGGGGGHPARRLQRTRSRRRGGPGLADATHQSRRGKRSSTYHAFLEGETERRPNLTIITGAQATRVVFATGGRSI